MTFGISDFFGGLKSRTTALLGVLLVSQGTALVLIAATVVALGDGPPGGAFLLAAAGAVVTETVGVAALYRGLAAGNMSIAAPVVATAPVVPVVVAAVNGELPSPLQGVGIALAVTGIVLVSRARRPSPTTGSGVRTSIVLGLLAALGFGSSYAAVGAASEASVPWALLVAQLTVVTIFLAAALVPRSPLAVRRAELPALALIGGLIVSADSLYAVATTQGQLGVVAVLSSLYPLVTIGLARCYLHERLEPLQQIGIAICSCGIVAVAAG